MPTRLKYEDVKLFFEENKCVLLSKKYKNSKENLKYKAQCGHIRISRLDRIKIFKRFRCETCSSKTSSSKTSSRKTSSSKTCSNNNITGMHPKTFQKIIKIMERKINNSIKYKNDFLPENYNQELVCWDCKETKNRKLFPYRKQYKYNKEKRCKLCNSINKEYRRNNLNINQKINEMICSAKSTAKRRLNRGRKEAGVITITIDDVLRILQKQKYKCVYTGVKLSWEYNNPYKASIDRIDSSKGYTPDNIQIVSFIVNQAKSNLDDKTFLKMVKQIYNNKCIK